MGRIATLCDLLTKMDRRTSAKRSGARLAQHQKGMRGNRLRRPQRRNLRAVGRINQRVQLFVVVAQICGISKCRAN